MRTFMIAAAALLVPLSAFADPPADVGDRVELRATHHLGVPLHRVASSSMFGRAPDGSVGDVVEVSVSNGWVRLELSDGRVGWVSPRYVVGVVDVHPPPPPPPSLCAADAEDRVWTSRQECEAVIAAGCRLPRESGALRAGTWNVRWFPKGCSPSETCPENATDLEWLACTITWMDVELLAVEEILDDPGARVAIATVIDRLEAVGGDWEVDLQACGPPRSQHVGFLWRADRVTLTAFADVEELNGAAPLGGKACSANLRPGRYAHAAGVGGGADFHVVSVHLDSGKMDRDYQNRRTAIDRLDLIEVAGAPILNSDVDLLVLGDFNTMGRNEPPSISASLELELFEEELRPGFRVATPQIACTEFFNGHGGTLDHVVASLGMQEAPRDARVSGYCAVRSCSDFMGFTPAAFEVLSDHCPVLVDLQNADLDD